MIAKEAKRDGPIVLSRDDPLACQGSRSPLFVWLVWAGSQGSLLHQMHMTAAE